jgi:hypothetical protein
MYPDDGGFAKRWVLGGIAGRSRGGSGIGGKGIKE